jgi:hypothetical protein
MAKPRIPVRTLQQASLAAILVLSGSTASAQTSAPATAVSVRSDPLALSTVASPEVPMIQQKAESSQTAAATHPTAVTVLEDTLIRVLTNVSIDSRVAKHGTAVGFTVSEDVLVGDVLVIPRGSTVHGVVIKSKNAGVLTGSNELTFKLVSLDLSGRSYPLYTYQFKVQGTSKTGPTETKAVRGAYVGALVGAATGSVSAKGESSDVGRVASMTAGAAVGAGVGTIVSAATPGPGIRIPAEAQVDFYLASPISLPRANAEEAGRLAKRLHPGGPSLYVRGDGPE